MNMIKFGAHIARLRKEHDMPQSALADTLCVTRQAVSKWERGEGFPDISLLGALADVFNVSVDCLLRGGEISQSTAEVLSSAAEGQEIPSEALQTGALADIIHIAPYLKVSTLTTIADKLARHNINIGSIVEFSEFMNDEDVIKLLENSDSAPDDKMLEKLIPFLDFESIYSIFEKIMKGQNGVELFDILRPHMGQPGTSLIEAAFMQGLHAPNSGPKAKTKGITMKNLGKKYHNGIVAVNNVSLEIGHGEVVALLGPSGCGKTSLLRMIAGLEEITDGELYMGETLVNKLEPKDRDVTMVFQTHALFPFMTVGENIAFGAKDGDKTKVEEIAELMGVSHLLGSAAHNLPMYQRARVTICRALISDSNTILLDEVFSNLDAKQRPILMAEIMQLRHKFPKTFIFVTHDQGEAMAMADRIILMRDGVIVQDNTPAGLYARPNSVFSAGFVGSPQMNFWRTTVSEHGGDLYVNFGMAKVKLLDARLGAYIGKEIIAGVRPEHLYVNTGEGLAVDVTLSIYCSRDERQLHFTIDGTDFITFAPGDCNSSKVVVSVNTEKLHFFDVDTELAI